jgi:hypothetical protein
MFSMHKKINVENIPSTILSHFLQCDIYIRKMNKKKKSL